MFSLATFIALAVVSFVGVDALPGDGCTALLGRFGTNAKIDACRQENNLNDSVVVRLKDWSGNLVRGDLGYSIKRDEQVSEIIIPRLRNTAVMAAVAALIAFPSAIVVGLLLGRYPRKRISKAVNQFSVIAMTLPECVLVATLAECLASGVDARSCYFCALNAHDAGECDQRAKHAVC
ncbi:MAG: ABC transporter permease [Actinobacteria bacterium]|nr:ABC transporter permease [Actinomycetota bacterium]